MSNSIPLRYDYMSHLPFFPAEGSKGCEREEIRDPRDGYTHAKGQQIFTDLESSGHGKKDVGTLVSYRQDEGKTFPCKVWSSYRSWPPYWYQIYPIKPILKKKPLGLSNYNNKKFTFYIEFE